MSVDISDAGAKASVSVFVRSKSGPSPAGKMVHVSATSKAADDPHLKCAPINHLARFSADGSVLGAVEADGVRVLRADGSVPYERAESGGGGAPRAERGVRKGVSAMNACCTSVPWTVRLTIKSVHPERLSRGAPRPKSPRRPLKAAPVERDDKQVRNL